MTMPERLEESSAGESMLSHEDDARHFRGFPTSMLVLPRHRFDCFFVEQCPRTIDRQLQVCEQFRQSVLKWVRLDKCPKCDLALILQRLANESGKLDSVNHDLREQRIGVDFGVTCFQELTGD